MISIYGEVVLDNCCISGPESVSIYDYFKGIFVNDFILLIRQVVLEIRMKDR